MKLKLKFIISICTVVVISYGMTFYRTSAFQEDLLVSQAARQAGMLYNQLRLTRQWVADHNGLFLVKRSGVAASPFLPDSEVSTVDGVLLVKRNPAMVTRELSVYAAREGLGQFSVTSLHPVNPANAPDSFEEQSLLRFEQGSMEEIFIEDIDGKKRLRYIAPLIIEESCLVCHVEQHHKIGDIRGGLSVIIPIEWAYADIRKNNLMLLEIALITILLVSIVLLYMVDSLVVRRLLQLEQAMERYPQDIRPEELAALSGGTDEIGKLSDKFKDLCRRLDSSQQELNLAQEQIFQNEKLASLGRLVAGVGHEINNPLAGMRNCVKSMQEAPEDKEQIRRYLPLLSKGLDRITHTVRQLLNFGRREVLHPQSLDLDHLIRECFELLGYGLGNIDFKFNSGLQENYYLDKEALKQIVMNIGINSIQAMPDGGSLSVSTYPSGNNIIVDFRDTGVGIAAENLRKIFDPFYTSKEVGEGTGLGLSITYTLLKRMGGNIRVESEEGKGSCFTIELPVFENSAAKEAKNNNEKQ